MARKAKIDTDTLISLVGQFYAEKCDNNPAALKIPAIGEYIRSQGYDVADYLIRRNHDVRDYITKLQNNAEETYINSVTVYRDMDVTAFVEKNNTPSKLIRAIKERENYYREVTTSAAYCFQENKKLQKRLHDLEKRIKELENSIVNDENTFSETSRLCKELKAENVQLRNIVDTYVYPEIANELLKKQGLLKTTAGIVDADKVEGSIINSDTDVSPIKNNILKGLFDKV